MKALCLKHTLVIISNVIIFGKVGQRSRSRSQGQICLYGSNYLDTRKTHAIDAQR